jgi:Flp pilus assembly protein TadB
LVKKWWWRWDLVALGVIVVAVVHHFGWIGVVGIAGYAGVVWWLAKRYRDRHEDQE